MTLLTDAQLAAIAERAEKALEGPWDYKAGIFKHYVYSPTNEHFGFSMQEMSYLDGSDCPWTAATADFIAQSRSDVPALLDHSTALAARLAEAQATIGQRVATIHGLSTIIDGHEAEVEDLAQRCDKALIDLATAQARIERLTTALERFARRNNWDTALNLLKHNGVCLTNEQGEPCYFWDPADRPWETARAALAPPTPEADDAK